MARKKKKEYSEILGIYNRVKPVKWDRGFLVHYPQMDGEKLEMYDYRRIQNIYAFPQKVSEAISVLADYKVTFPAYAGGIFKITYAQVVKKIPQEIFEEVKYFEIIYVAESSYERKVFPEAIEKNEFVAVLRLYKEAKESDESVVRPSERFPDFTKSLPIGMTIEEAQKLLEVRDYMDRKGLY